MRAALLVLVLFVVLTIGMTWPLVLHAGSGVEDLHDALLNTWILAWDGHQLLTDPVQLFDANIFFPYRDTLAFSEIILPQALLALPVTAASGNPVLGYNVALLASFALSAFAAYLLVLRLTGSLRAGVAAGVVFAFNAYMMSNLAQAQLLAVQWLPLALLYLARTLRPSAAQRHAWRDAFLLALFVALQALSSFYYALMSGLALALALVVALLTRRVFSATALLRAVAALALALAIVVPFALPYLRVERTLGFKRALADSEPFSASLAQYGEALPGSLLYGTLAPQAPTVIGGYPLDSLFPGVATLVLAFIGLAANRRRAHLWLYPALLALGAFVLSLGPKLALATGRQVALPVPMPYALLYLLPGMQALRAPVRFAVLVFLGLSILVGLAVAAIEKHGRESGGRRGLVAAALCVLLVADVAGIGIATITPAPVGDAVPALYRWLAQQAPGVVLELPMMKETPQRGLLTQYFSIYHWQATPDGYSGFVPPRHGEIAYEMDSFPSERSVSLLQGLGVDYVVIHSDLLRDWPERAAALPSFATRISYVSKFGDALVYRVAPAPPGQPVQASLYLPASAPSAQTYVASLVLSTVDGATLVTSPTETAAVAAVWRTSGGAIVRQEKQTAALPIVVSEAGVAAVSLRHPGDGVYHVSVTARLPGGVEASATATVTISSAAPAPAQVAPVRLVSAEPARRSYQPGETMQVSLVWRALGKVDAYYSAFVRLLDANGQAVVQVDGQPAGGAKPTLLWTPGEEVTDERVLTLPSSTPPGIYTLEAGLYAPEDVSARLTLDSTYQPIERLLLGFVRVARPLAAAGAPSLPLAVAFGERATLLGYDIEGCTWVESDCHAAPGDTLSITLYWRADADMTVDYNVFLHLADAAGKPLAQDDGRPQDGAYPTTVWQRGDVVADARRIETQRGLAGEFTLLVGLYDPLSGARLQAPAANDAAPLLTVVIE